MASIYKILTEKEWSDFKNNGFFSGTKLDQKDKFIHLAFKHQYPALIEKFFKDARQVVIIEIDPQKLNKGDLKIEANKPGGEKYPHLYNAIPFAAVSSYEVLDLTPALTPPSM